MPTSLTAQNKYHIKSQFNCKKNPKNYKCNGRKQDNIFKILGGGKGLQNKIQNPGATTGSSDTCDLHSARKERLEDKVPGEHACTAHMGHARHT